MAAKPELKHLVVMGAALWQWVRPSFVQFAGNFGCAPHATHCLPLLLQRLRQTVLLLSEAKSGGSPGAEPAAGGSELSELHPQNLEGRFMDEVSTGNCCHAASTEDGQAGGGGSGVAASAEEGGRQPCPGGVLKVSMVIAGGRVPGIHASVGASMVLGTPSCSIPHY